MQTFKTYFKISRKYLTGFFIYVPIFLVVMMMMVNQQSKNNQTSFASSTIRFSVFDHDHSALSLALTDYLEQHHKRVSINEDMKSIKDNIYQRKIDYICILPEGLEENKESIITYQIPNSRFAAFADSQINKFIRIFSAYKAAGLSSSEAADKTITTMSEETTISMLTAEKKDISIISIFFNYMTYILISIIALCISPILILFNEKMIQCRLNVSCISPLRRNLALTAASFLYSFGIAFVFILSSFAFFGKDMLNDKSILRIGNTLVYTLLCLSLTFLLATCFTRQNVISALINLIGLGQSFITGVFVDRSLMSKVVLHFGKIFPSYWYVNVENEVEKYHHLSELTASSRQTILLGFLMELLFAVGFFMIAMVVGRRKIAE